MFDAIGVSGRTQKPWTVVVSFIGQVAAIGLAILVPLVGTDALPHRLSWVSLPAPPPGIHHKTAAAAATKQAAVVPSQITPKGLVLPGRIPEKPVMLSDPDFMPTSGDPTGAVEGGLEGSNGPGNGVIRSLVSQVPTAAPPPPPVAIREVAKPVKRIVVGGNVQKGKLISGPRPVYPPLAKQARVGGVVRIQAVISRDGAILDLHAVSGHPLLVPAALAAVQHWIFSPTYLDGDPVEVATEIEVNFVLQ